MAIIKKELPLVFQYIQISSPIPFYIYGSDNEKAKRLLPSNAYVLRSAELLTSEKAPNQPIWKVYIEYDSSLLTDGRVVEINGFNVDFSKYLETFGGQLVRFGDDQLNGLYTVINTPSWSSILSTLATSAKQDTIIEKIPSVSTLATSAKQDTIIEKIPSVSTLAKESTLYSVFDYLRTIDSRLLISVYGETQYNKAIYQYLRPFNTVIFEGQLYCRVKTALYYQGASNAKLSYVINDNMAPVILDGKYIITPTGETSSSDVVIIPYFKTCFASHASIVYDNIFEIRGQYDSIKGSGIFYNVTYN